MSTYVLPKRNKVAGTLTAGALAIAAVAGAGIATAPTAHASCISVFSIGGGANCSSSLTSIAIAIGKNTQAQADGILTAALVLGSDGSYAIAFPQALLSAAIGIGSVGSGVTGIASFAGAFGANALAFVGRKFGNVANVSLAIGRDASADTQGSANLALDFLGGQSTSKAIGFGNAAVNIFSRSTTVQAQKPGFIPQPEPANLSLAFSVLGSNNKVSAGPGPLALAGSIFQKGATVTKEGPGFNINGFRIGGAASRPVSPAAARTQRAATRVQPSASGRSRTHSKG